MLQAFELEDIIKCRSQHDYTPRLQPGAKTYPWTGPMWTYKCVARPYAMKVRVAWEGVRGAGLTAV